MSNDVRPTAPAPATGLAHGALIYGSDEEYIDAVVPFVREGLERGESVSVVAPPHNIDLRGALSPTARR